jgi:hypothetical protein
MQTAGEQITVPNMNFSLLSQLPLALVLRSGFASLSAANGQFMFFKADTYKDKQPHLYFKQAKVEDIETARYFKKNKIRIACLTGNDAVACRMYSGYKDAVNGFSKNVVMFFGNSFPLAIAFWLFTTFGLAFIAVCGSIWLVMLYLILVILTRIFISIVSRQSVILNLIYLVPQQFSMGEFIYRAITNSLKKQYQWKGRNI